MRRNHLLLSTAFIGSVVGLAGLAGAATGCAWTDFDDLADQTPVHRISDPNAVPSADFARVIIEANSPTPGEGSSVAVLSASELTLSFVDFDAKGGSSIPGETVSKIKTKFAASPTFPAAGAFISDDLTRDVAITTIDNVGQQSFILFGHNDILVKRSFIATANPVYAAFIHQSTASTGPRLIAYGAVNKIFTVVVDTAASDTTLESECVFTTEPLVVTDSPTPQLIISMSSGELDGDATDGSEVAVWFSNGDVAVYSADVFAACGADEPTPITAAFPSLVIPGEGDRIYVTEHRAIVLAKFGGEGEIKVLDYSGGLTADPSIFASQATPGLAAVGFGDLGGDGTDEIIGGFPDEDVDGVTRAGTAKIFSQAGGSLQLELTLHDADPATDQAFGRTVLITPFNTGGKAVVFVGASKSLYTYYSAGTQYDDVRSP